MRDFLEWFESHPEFLIAISISSILFVVVSIIGLGAAMIMMPPDFLDDKSIDASRSIKNKSKYIFVAIFRNVLGFILVLIGLMLLVLPGQGLLTILFGLLLLDLPYKRRIKIHLKKLLRKPRSLNKINRLRRKFGQRPLQV